MLYRQPPDKLSFMKTKDTRKISKEARAELRNRAVQAFLSTPGKNMGKMAKTFSVRRQTLRKWVRDYKKSGEKSFSFDFRGAKKWQNAKLSPQQSGALRRIIINKTPEQLQFPFMLWTRHAIRDLVLKRYNIKLGMTTISDYMKKWGMTSQKPKLRSYRQQPEVVQKWIMDVYPSIKKEAKNEGATIHWGDETAIRSQDQVGKGYSLCGKTPVLKTSGGRFGVNMISSITNQGTMRFMLFEGSNNAKKFVDFLRRLTKNQKRKIFLILDNARVHHAIIVQEWLEKHKNKIKVFYLPTYSPEYNPDELLNNTLKSKLKNTTKAQNKESLVNTVSSILKSLQKTPKIIRSFFDTETTRYAL